MAGETPTTELQAVNAMLNTIGETPIDSLEVSGLLYAEQSISILNEISRDVQMSGWHFNSETNYPLALSLEGEIEIPLNALEVDTTKEYKAYDVVVRGSRLYNKTNHSFIFDKGIKVDIVFFLPFDHIPESARRYITIKAARTFQDRVVGADALHAYTVTDESEAKVVLEDREAVSADFNILHPNY